MENNTNDQNEDASGWYYGIFYVNPKDPKIFVQKRFGFGWTLNFGNKYTYLIIIILVLITITFKHFA